MAESNIKVSKGIHDNKNTEEHTVEVNLVRKTEDIKDKNNDSTISLKSFKMMDDDKHRREDQSKIDNGVKTNRNQNNSEDIQEEVRAPKCCDCIYEVSEFLPWFCINIGRWCSNSFKRNCCCNKKVKKKRGGLYEEDEEYWDGDIINEGDLTRYSLPVCVDDGDEDNCIKIKFHRNEGYDDGEDIKIENVDFQKCVKANKGDIDNNKESEQDTKTGTHGKNNRSNSQGDCDVPSNLNGNVSHQYISDLQKCDIEYKGATGWSKKNDHDTKTVTHDENNRSNVSDDLQKCNTEYKGVGGWSRENYFGTKTARDDNNHHGYSHKHSDVSTNSDGVSSNDHYNYFYKNKEDIHKSQGNDHDTKTVTSRRNTHSYGHGHSDVHSSSHGITSDNYVGGGHNTNSHTDNPHSYGHGHSDVHSSSHGITSDSHVSYDNTDCSGGDTGYSGGDTGGCDAGGSDW